MLLTGQLLCDAVWCSDRITGESGEEEAGKEQPPYIFSKGLSNYPPPEKPPPRYTFLLSF